jgi:hypothetical protein
MFIVLNIAAISKIFANDSKNKIFSSFFDTTFTYQYLLVSFSFSLFASILWCAADKSLCIQWHSLHDLCAWRANECERTLMKLRFK